MRSSFALPWICFAGFIYVLGLSAMGCREASGTGGGAGAGGVGGGGGHGCYPAGVAPSCPESPINCVGGDVGAVEPCCELSAPPAQENACDGTESLVNPAQCTMTGNMITYRVSLLQLVEDCNRGFNLDGCDGNTCVRGEDLGEGVDGVDNGLATLVSAMPGSGEGDMESGLNQAFADAICGLTGPACETPIPALSLELTIGTEPEESCAQVIVRVNGSEAGRAILNLGEVTAGGTRCVSGLLGALPLTLGDEAVTLSNVVMQATISDAGLSDGLLGGTADSRSAALLGELSYPGLGPLIGAFLDINDDLGACPTSCEALSGTYRIGGIAEAVR